MDWLEMDRGAMGCLGKIADMVGIASDSPMMQATPGAYL